MDTSQGDISSLYRSAVFLLAIAVAVLRLNDSGRSGRMMLLGLINFIGSIVLLLCMCEVSGGSNQYGEPPLLEAGARGDDSGLVRVALRCLCLIHRTANETW